MSENKKIFLTIMLTVFTVISGCIAVDCGTAHVSGDTPMVLKMAGVTVK